MPDDRDEVRYQIERHEEISDGKTEEPFGKPWRPWVAQDTLIDGYLKPEFVVCLFEHHLVQISRIAVLPCPCLTGDLLIPRLKVTA
jgi:hypothetical protein